MKKLQHVCWASLIGHAVNKHVPADDKAALTMNHAAAAPAARRQSRTILVAAQPSRPRRDAFCADVSLTLGGTIKFKEMLSSRYPGRALVDLPRLRRALVPRRSTRGAEGADKFLEYAMSELLRDIGGRALRHLRQLPDPPARMGHERRHLPEGAVHIAARERHSSATSRSRQHRVGDP